MLRSRRSRAGRTPSGRTGDKTYETGETGAGARAPETRARRRLPFLWMRCTLADDDTPTRKGVEGGPHRGKGCAVVENGRRRGRALTLWTPVQERETPRVARWRARATSFITAQAGRKSPEQCATAALRR